MTSCCMNFAIIIQGIYFTIWEKVKKNHHHYNTILSLYNIISRHYKKSLLRSQIYHGYEELSTGTNYPIWRRQEEASMQCSLLHGSWDHILQRRPSVTSYSQCSCRRIMKFSFFLELFPCKRSWSAVKGQGHTGLKIDNFGPNWTFPKLQFEFTIGYKMMCKAWSSNEEVSYCFSRSSVKFQGHMGHNIADFD